MTAEVELDEVAELGRATLDGDQRRALAAQLLELALDVLLGYRVVLAGRLDHERIGQRALRAQPDGRREAEGLALVGQHLPVDVGRARSA